MTNRPNRLEPRKPGRLIEVLGTKLRRLVIGQDKAVRKILDLYQMYVTGMTSPGRPIGNILFLGPFQHSHEMRSKRRATRFGICCWGFWIKPH
jgi:hypothetical protein